MDDVQEAPRIARRIERKVEDIVHPLVILADFVARRRKESEQNPVLRIFAADPLDDGASLLELAERCHMHPYDPGRRIDGLGHPFEQSFAPFRPKFRFPVLRSDQAYGPAVAHQSEIIDPHQCLQFAGSLRPPSTPSTESRASAAIPSRRAAAAVRSAGSAPLRVSSRRSKRPEIPTGKTKRSQR